MAAKGKGKGQPQRVPAKKKSAPAKKKSAPAKAAAKRRAFAPSRRLRAPAAKPTAAKALIAARGTTEGDQAQSVDFDTFFDRVGEGLVKAQQNMDTRSLEYIKGLAGQPNIMPSLFRIPKLSADLKFALDTTQSETVGFIFHKNETTQETRNQQSIQFDIVAVPATPHPSAPIPGAPLFVNIPFSDQQREAIFAKLDATVDTTVPKTDPSKTKALANKDRVLIYTPDGGNSYYLLYAESGASTSIAFWYLVMEPATLVTVRKFNDSGPVPGLLAWQKMLLQQADEQEQYLKKVRQSG